MLITLTGVAPFLACSPFEAIVQSTNTGSGGSVPVDTVPSNVNLVNAFSNKQYTVDEWMSLSAEDRYAARSAMATTERFALWDQLSLAQKKALTEINKNYEAILIGELGIKPAGSPFSVNQWMIKSPAERAGIRASLASSGVDLWNALSLEQKYALTETNEAYNRTQNSADLCAASGYPDIQHLDIPISFSRTVLPFFFGNETIAVAKFTIPEGNSPTAYLDATFAEYDGPPTFRQTTISTRPCDFRQADKTGATGPISVSGGVTTMNLIEIGADKSEPHLIPGRTYYMNVRNWATDFNDGAGGPSCQEDRNCKGSFVIVIRN